MKRTDVIRLLSAFLVLAGLAAAQCPAGGYPPPPPPYTVPGGGDPAYTGPVGTPTPPVPPPPLTPNPGGGTTGQPGGGTTPALGGTTRLNSGPKGGRSPRPRVGSPKKFRNLWTDRITVDWTPVFPPVDAQKGYDGSAQGLAQGVKRPVSDGGWDRDDAPSIVLVYDPSSKSDLKTIAALERDNRFKVATWVFNAFKIDARQLTKKERGLRLLVFDNKGTLVKELTGKNMRKAMKPMETAYRASTKRSLSKVMPHLERNVGGIAYCKEKIAWLESRIVCTDCGKAHDTPKNIAKFKKDMGRYEEALAGFRGN